MPTVEPRDGGGDAGTGASPGSRSLLRSLVAPGAQRVAVRAAVTVLVALLVLEQIGRLRWGVYATFGVFAGVYGGPQRWSGRLRLQVVLGLVLVAAVTSGAAVGVLPTRRWIAIPVVAAWAVITAKLSDRYHWRPPGPMLVVFAVATSAAVPAVPRDVAAACLVSAATATGAVALAAAEHVIFREREPAPGPMWAPASARRQAVHAVRCGVAVSAAGLSATATGIGHPYWAMVASVVPLSVPVLRAQVTRSVHRAAGTLVGLLLAAGFLQLRPGPVVVIIFVALLQGLIELVIARLYGLALVFVTPLALMLVRLAVPVPTSTLLSDRLVETLLGLTIGTAVAAVTRQRADPAPATS